jgi:hypothetical protein
MALKADLPRVRKQYHHHQQQQQQHQQQQQQIPIFPVGILQADRMALKADFPPRPQAAPSSSHHHHHHHRQRQRITGPQRRRPAAFAAEMGWRLF